MYTYFMKKSDVSIQCRNCPPHFHAFLVVPLWPIHDTQENHEVGFVYFEFCIVGIQTDNKLYISKCYVSNIYLCESYEVENSCFALVGSLFHSGHSLLKLLCSVESFFHVHHSLFKMLHFVLQCIHIFYNRRK